MTLPFDAGQFFAVFARYNTAVWPAQMVLIGLALVAVASATRPRTWSGPTIGAILALFWIWMGGVYHIAFFHVINPAALAFGVGFVVQGLALAVFGTKLRFAFRAAGRGVVGAVLIAYALIAYPAIGWAVGQRYPATPTFGLPCPTTIFTLGLLLWTEPRHARPLMIVPLAWSLIGTSAAFQFGVWQDLALGAAGLAAAVAVFAPAPGDRRTRPSGRPAPAETAAGSTRR